MTKKRTKIRRPSVVVVLQVSAEGAFRTFSNDSEDRRFFWIVDEVTLSDPPQRFGVLGNVHHGSLVRKLCMDTVHIRFILPAALFFKAYVQLPDISSAKVTDVMKPQEDGEETAPMFDEEFEAV